MTAAAGWWWGRVAGPNLRAVALAGLASVVGSAVALVAPVGMASAASGVSASVPSCQHPALVTRTELASTTGVGPHTVRVGNVATVSGIIPGLFAGAPVGVRAYLADVNAHGGVHGRQLVFDPADDGFNGTLDQAETTRAMQQDFAVVGSFSLFDQNACTALASDAAVPDVSVTLDPSAGRLADVFSVDPTVIGWETGPFAYFKAHFPAAIKSVGSLVGDSPVAIDHWLGIKAAMEHLGYHVALSIDTSPFTNDYTSDIVALRAAHVQLLDITAEPVTADGAIIQDMDAQNWHPLLVVSGGPIYDDEFVTESGGASAVDQAAVDGVWLNSTQALYLGQDAKSIPAVGTFDRWVQKVDPGFHPDLYTLFGWASAQLFVQALRAAGRHPTRGSVLAALRRITRFTGSGLLSPADPAAKKPPSCYLLARVVHGKFVRVADPPQGRFRCDGSFFAARSGG